MDQYKQPWLASASKDTWLILMPAILPVIAVIVFHDYFTSAEVSTLWWIVLVLCIDVAHVYSTLFRLYWEKDTFERHRKLLLIIPLCGFIVGFALHYYDSMMFWRILAYVAVFHFVRQQYGFMRLYSRKESIQNQTFRWIDTLSIYNATLYPLLYWHVHATDKISWFLRGDFISLRIGEHFQFFSLAYIIVAGAYFIKEIIQLRKGSFNIPKNLLMLGTYASWFVGIVLFQGDLIFTLLNVVAHGIPYMGLIWIYGEQKSKGRFTFSIKGILIFALVLLFFAFIEEFFWDSFVWQDHQDIFGSWNLSIGNQVFLSTIIATLALPQITHYILDGFIWRRATTK